MYVHIKNKSKKTVSRPFFTFVIWMSVTCRLSLYPIVLILLKPFCPHNFWLACSSWLFILIDQFENIFLPVSCLSEVQTLADPTPILHVFSVLYYVLLHVEVIWACALKHPICFNKVIDWNRRTSDLAIWKDWLCINTDSYWVWFLPIISKHFMVFFISDQT